MMTLSVKSTRRNEMIDITDQVARALAEAKVQSGFASLFVPHTTAAVTINENADPDVVHDLLLALERLIPQHQSGFRHAEGNSDAHLKSSLVGVSLQVPIENGKLVLGTWQGIYFCEFDGPRTRQIHLNFIT